MNTEPQWIAIYIERIFEDMLETLKALSDDVLNRPMPVPDANTLFAIATHSVGMAEFWVLALVGGQPVQRDRPAEFRAAGTGADLEARIGRFTGAAHALLDDLPASRMDEMISSRGYAAREGSPDELTVREALLHVFEHSATHLGHVQLTADYFQAHAVTR